MHNVYIISYDFQVKQKIKNTLIGSNHNIHISLSFASLDITAIYAGYKLTIFFKSVLLYPKKSQVIRQGNPDGTRYVSHGWKNLQEIRMPMLV